MTKTALCAAMFACVTDLITVNLLAQSLSPLVELNLSDPRVIVVRAT